MLDQVDNVVMDQSLFLLKKFFGQLLMPVPMTLLLLLLALLLVVRRTTRWFGALLVLLASALLFAGSYPPLSSTLIAHQEARIPSYEKTDDHPRVDYVAVLGSWHQSTDAQPVTSELSPTAIVRLSEGLRVYYLNPGSKLIFTGYHGRHRDPVSYPAKLRELALALQVPEEDILVLDGPRDTIEEARLIAESFPAAQLVLVTSAAHMQRALGLFRGAGLDPIPAPTEHLGKPMRSRWTFPNAQTLARSAAWAHEALGLLWARLMGQLPESPSDGSEETQ